MLRVLPLLLWQLAWCNVVCSCAHANVLQGYIVLHLYCWVQHSVPPVSHSTGREVEPEVYPRPDGTVYVCGEQQDTPLPHSPAQVRMPHARAVTDLA